MLKRGFTHAEAMAYVGVKRRTFEELWRPRLVALQQGVTTIFDKADLDKLFDEFKRQAAGEPAAANDAHPLEQNGPRNGRPSSVKGNAPWVKKQQESIPAKTESGKSTSGGGKLDFASVVSQVTKRQRAG